MRQDRAPIGLLGCEVETSNTSTNGTGALSVAATQLFTRTVVDLKTLRVRLSVSIRPVEINLLQMDRRGGKISVFTIQRR